MFKINNEQSEILAWKFKA